MDNKYVDQFHDLKIIVKAQAGEAAMKLSKLKDESSKKNLMIQRLTKIREQIDKMINDLGAKEIIPQLGMNPGQEQQRQLQQVKQTLTSFLQQAGKQMKSSEEDLNTVIKIINLDEDVMQHSTNSLIIKLWNTILTSVGEFKRTYTTNQLEVTQKLDVMDVKLDAIMDKIESGHNEMLLELYKMSKVQDLMLDKSQEKAVVQLVQLQTTKLEIWKPQLNTNNVGVQTSILKDIQFSQTLQMEIQIQAQHQETNNQANNLNKSICSVCNSSSPSKEEKKQENLSINGKYSEQIMKALQEKAHSNAYERFKMRRQQETEWRYKQYNNGSVYEGEFLKGTDIRDGQGIIIFNDGEVYEGQWKNDKLHGYGEYYWKNGDNYQGQWSESKRNGYGVYYWNDGRRYQGEWKDNNKHGLGIWHYKNKDIEIGQWIDSKQDGQHVKITTNKDIYQVTYEMHKQIKEKKLT